MLVAQDAWWASSMLPLLVSGWLVTVNVDGMMGCLCVYASGLMCEDEVWYDSEFGG